MLRSLARSDACLRRSAALAPRSCAAAALLSSLCVLAPACDDGSADSMDDDDTPSYEDHDHYDTAGGGGGAGDEPPAAGCPGDPSVAPNPQGILSRYPGQSWLLGPDLLVPTTASYRVTEDGDPRGPLLEMFVEVRNDGSTECTFLPDVSIDGVEVLGLITADPFVADYSTVTSECLGPGGVGVYTGVARGLTEADLERSASVVFYPNPNTFVTHLPADEPALLDRRVEEVDEGRFAFVATLSPHRTIYNYGLRVYPKDAQGLVIGELLDFPNELDTLDAGTSWPVETLGIGCRFGEYHAYQSWIDGSASGLVPPSDDSGDEDDGERLRRDRRAQMDRIRGSVSDLRQRYP